MTGVFRVLPFGTQADPRGSGHGRHSIYRSESGKPTAIRSVNGVFALTLTVKVFKKPDSGGSGVIQVAQHVDASNVFDTVRSPAREIHRIAEFNTCLSHEPFAFLLGRDDSIYLDRINDVLVSAYGFSDTSC